MYFNVSVFNLRLLCLQELKESFNYGLFVPPANGKAGKFLDEERHLTDYPFSGPVGYLEVSKKHSQNFQTLIPHAPNWRISTFTARGTISMQIQNKLFANTTTTRGALLRVVVYLWPFLFASGVGCNCDRVMVAADHLVLQRKCKN